jgi:hypothetical protein
MHAPTTAHAHTHAPTAHTPVGPHVACILQGAALGVDDLRLVGRQHKAPSDRRAVRGQDAALHGDDRAVGPNLHTWRVPCVGWVWGGGGGGGGGEEGGRGRQAARSHPRQRQPVRPLPPLLRAGQRESPLAPRRRAGRRVRARARRQAHSPSGMSSPVGLSSRNPGPTCAQRGTGLPFGRSSFWPQGDTQNPCGTCCRSGLSTAPSAAIRQLRGRVHVCKRVRACAHQQVLAGARVVPCWGRSGTRTHGRDDRPAAAGGPAATCELVAQWKARPPARAVAPNPRTSWARPPCCQAGAGRLRTAGRRAGRCCSCVARAAARARAAAHRRGRASALCVCVCACVCVCVCWEGQKRSSRAGAHSSYEGASRDQLCSRGLPSRG